MATTAQKPLFFQKCGDLKFCEVYKKSSNAKTAKIPKTTPRYMKFCPIKIRIIHEVRVCTYNANSMVILSPYIRGRVVIQVVLFSRLYGMRSQPTKYFLFFYFTT